MKPYRDFWQSLTEDEKARYFPVVIYIFREMKNQYENYIRKYPQYSDSLFARSLRDYLKSLEKVKHDILVDRAEREAQEEMKMQSNLEEYSGA